MVFTTEHLGAHLKPKIKCEVMQLEVLEEGKQIYY